MDKQEAQRQRGGQNGAGGHVAAPRTPQAQSEQVDSEGRQHARYEQPQQGSHSEQGRSRRPGEAHIRQAVPGEALAAQHHEITYHPGQDGNYRARDEGVLHEMIVKQTREI